MRSYGIAAVLTVVLLSGSCGYSLAGRGSFLPDYVRVVGIPLFTNATQFFDVEQVLTQKVREEFIGRGRYKVLPDPEGVDALLLGVITAISVEPASFTGQQQASRYIISLTARIEFRDLKTDRVLWQNPSLVFREEYEVASGGGAFSPDTFFGQETNALERMAGDFAKTVVTSILEAF